MNNKINALFFNLVEFSVCKGILMQFMLLLSFLLPAEFIAGFVEYVLLPAAPERVWHRSPLKM